eukprot:g2151.t1
MVASLALSAFAIGLFAVVEDSPEGRRVVTYDAHYHTSRLEHELADVTDELLSSRLLHRVRREAIAFDAEMKTSLSRVGRHGFWLPLNGTTGRIGHPGGARFAIEHAIELMLRQDYPHVAQRARVGGVEWWVQQRGALGDVGFHYDKDEKKASQGLLRCPLESTITYLTSGASPTLIMNRTTPDGNGCDPLVPTSAALVYPRAGRHVLFRGNLAHGVLGSLSAGGYGDRVHDPFASTSPEGAGVFVSGVGVGVDRSPGDAAAAAVPRQDDTVDAQVNTRTPARITLLANFWAEKPLHPNCQTLDDDRAASVLRDAGLSPWRGTGASTDTGSTSDSNGNGNNDIDESVAGMRRPLRDAPFVKADGHGSDPGSRWKVSGRGGEGHAVTLVEARLRFSDHFLFEVPAAFPRRELGAWRFKWRRSQVAGSWGLLDFDDNALMNYVFRSAEPKCLIFAGTSNSAAGDVWPTTDPGLKLAQRTLLPGLQAHVSDIKVLFGHAEQHADAYEVFGVEASTGVKMAARAAPIVVLHDTLLKRHAVMHLSDGFADAYTDDELSGTRVADFVASYLRGQLETVSDDEFEDESDEEGEL